MTIKCNKYWSSVLLLFLFVSTLSAQKNVVDEVIWVVGDEPILKSDVEAQRIDAEMNGVQIDGDPYCVIPEQLAIQKLYLHQAQLDSIEVSDSEVSQNVEDQLDRWIQLASSKEKLEEYKNMSFKKIREQLFKLFREKVTIENVQKKIVKDVKVTPAEVRRYFKDLSTDSIPFIPMQVEVQIITQTPQISRREKERVESELRDYTERINAGTSDFSTLALLYSEDVNSARKGGELDYAGRTEFAPAFSAVAFNLTDPKKVSKIVKTEYGYHIIQLIEKKGDKVKVRHILRKPYISQHEYTESLLRMDSIVDDIKNNKFTFDEATSHLSDDAETKNNYGLMINNTGSQRASKFQMKDLPQEVGVMVEKMQIGDVSKAFTMTNEKGQKVCAIVKLKNRIEGHKAIISEDYQLLKNVVLQQSQDIILNHWIKEKLKTTYVKIKDGWKNCNFKYSGWIK
ncbi:MAG: peptidylprolyl isomerase [Bacteroidaceae bacterium]